MKLLWETEEEIGSPHFEAALRKLGRAAATDAVVISDGSWLTRKRPTVAAGLRGFKGFRFTLETAEADAHSGIAGGAVRNPLAELMDLACALHDARTGRVKVPGFYDGIAKPTKKERADFLGSGFTVARFRKDNHVRLLRSERRARGDGAALDAADVRGARPRRRLPGPGPEVDRARARRAQGLVPAGAGAGPGPDRAPRRSPSRRSTTPTWWQRRRPAARPPRVWETTGPLAAAVKASVAFGFGREPAFVRDGGSIGTVLSMEKILGCPVGFLDLSMPDHGYHAPNENFEWAQAAAGMAAFARLVEEWSRAPTLALANLSIVAILGGHDRARALDLPAAAAGDVPHPAGRGGGRPPRLRDHPGRGRPHGRRAEAVAPARSTARSSACWRTA